MGTIEQLSAIMSTSEYNFWVSLFNEEAEELKKLRAKSKRNKK